MTQYLLTITVKIIAIIALSIFLNGCTSSDTEKEINNDITQSDTIQSPISVTEPKPSTESNPFAKDMVEVEGGTFKMGTNKYDTGKPIHKVTVTDFSISKYEVTQKQWRTIMGSDPEGLYFKACDQCPVEGVSWNDIQDFTKQLNEKTDKEYRLPSEAEWEYAAKGGAKTKGYIFSGSNNLKEVAWSLGKSDFKSDAGSTHPVGSKEANELGLYDMSGNVSEWCEDNWHDNYKNAPSNSEAWGGGNKYIRVIRGGSWFSYGANNSRSDSRNRSVDTNRDQTSGFRLAL